MSESGTAKTNSCYEFCVGGVLFVYDSESKAYYIWQGNKVDLVPYIAKTRLKQKRYKLRQAWADLLHVTEAEADYWLSHGAPPWAKNGHSFC
jgi:hypothetical protein